MLLFYLTNAIHMHKAFMAQYLILLHAYNKGADSLCISAVWSAPLLLALYKVFFFNEQNSMS